VLKRDYFRGACLDVKKTLSLSLSLSVRGCRRSLLSFSCAFFFVQKLFFVDTKWKKRSSLFTHENGKRRRRKRRREAHRRASVHILPDMRALILLGDSWIVREISNRWKSRGVRPHAQVALGARRPLFVASSSSRVREDEEIRKRERERGRAR
jgi:hypothetical protein